jgi:YHS domain-containing protein
LKTLRPLLLLALLAAGCTSLPPTPPAGAHEQHCLVCRHRRDFDCLSVEASPRTPHADYAGRTHYFCSEGCRREFQRQPDRYWSAR